MNKDYVDSVAGGQWTTVTGGIKFDTGTGDNVAIGAVTNFADANQALFIQNTTSAPTLSAPGGGLLYSDGGALKWMSPGGTITTIAPN